VPAFSPVQKGIDLREGRDRGEHRDLCLARFGDSWERRGNVQAQPMYYENIHPDPKVADKLYVPTVQTQVSNDGGRTFRGVGERNKHVDNHYVWIDPDNTDHLLEGCDGGLYESWDGGRLWRHFSNLSVTQFYNVDVDNASPIYNVYGGTQDNSTLGGPSRSKGRKARPTTTGSSSPAATASCRASIPTDPNIVYGESQYGGVVRLDRRTSERVQIRPVEDRGESALRFNWETPFIISPHSPTRLYFGASRLFRSDDRGNSWKPISPDLTRQTDRNTLPVMGRSGRRKPWRSISQPQRGATSPRSANRASAKGCSTSAPTMDSCRFRSIAAPTGARASVRQACLTTATTASYVNRLYAGKSDENVVYGVWRTPERRLQAVSLSEHEPRRSWESIAGDLPTNGPVLSFAEDHVNPNCSSPGTEFGLFFTVDGGKKWVRLRGNLPTIAVRDMVIQERENDLVLATFGRGFYILDDYTALRTLSQSTFDGAGTSFPAKAAMIEVPETGKGRGSHGENLWMSENRPMGAIFTYWIKDTAQSERQRRTLASRGEIKEARSTRRRRSSPRRPMKKRRRHS
jgi:hypothetical protein